MSDATLSSEVRLLTLTDSSFPRCVARIQKLSLMAQSTTIYSLKPDRCDDTERRDVPLSQWAFNKVCGTEWPSGSHRVSNQCSGLTALPSQLLPVLSPHPPFEGCDGKNERGANICTLYLHLQTSSCSFKHTHTLNTITPNTCLAFKWLL